LALINILSLEKNMKPSILCIGEVVIDFVSGKEQNSYIANPGGAPANVAIAASRLGINTAFCGKMGDDDLGRFLFRTLREDKVQVLGEPFTKDAFTTLTFVTLSSNGERSFSFARKPGADMFLSDKDIPLDALKSAVIVNAGSCSLSRETARHATHFAIQNAHTLNSLVSFDVNYRDRLWDDEETARVEIHKTLPFVDLLKISEEEAYLIGDEENIPEIMKSYDITVIVVTKGSRGAVCHFDDTSFYEDGYEADAVDTTGAGDAFWACFLSCLVKAGISKVNKLTLDVLKNAVRLSNVAGHICVQKKGAIPSFPTGEELRLAAKKLI